VQQAISQKKSFSTSIPFSRNSSPSGVMSVTALNMYEYSDSEFDAKMIIGDTVDELIDGLVDPLSAAQIVDRTIVAQCQDSYDDIISGERLRAITPEGWLGFL
jgi:hypothetical protein